MTTGASKWIVPALLVLFSSLNQAVAADVEFAFKSFLREETELGDQELPLSFQTKDIDWSFEMSHRFLYGAPDEVYMFGGLGFNR